MKRPSDTWTQEHSKTCKHADAMIDRVESRARQNARFRKAVARVWGWTRIPKEIRARLDMLVAEERRW